SALALWSTLVIATSLVHRPIAMGALIVVTFSVGGLVDLVMNVAATAALAEQPGKLVRFHALYNAGGAVGGLAAGLLIANHLIWRWAWTGTGAVGLVVAAICARSALPAG